MKTKQELAHEWAMKNADRYTAKELAEQALIYAETIMAGTYEIPEPLQQTFINGVEQPRYAPEINADLDGATV